MVQFCRVYLSELSLCLRDVGNDGDTTKNCESNKNSSQCYVADLKYKKKYEEGLLNNIGVPHCSNKDNSIVRPL